MFDEYILGPCVGLFCHLPLRTLDTLRGPKYTPQWRGPEAGGGHERLAAWCWPRLGNGRYRECWQMLGSRAVDSALPARFLQFNNLAVQLQHQYHAELRQVHEMETRNTVSVSSTIAPDGMF